MEQEWGVDKSSGTCFFEDHVGFLLFPTAVNQKLEEEESSIAPWLLAGPSHSLLWMFTWNYFEQYKSRRQGSR
jgi:hypothetical protein